MTARVSVSLFAIIIAMSLAASARAADSSINGTWKTTVKGQNGAADRVTTFTLKLDGDKLTGTVSGRNNTETQIEDGTFKDGTVSFSVTRDNNGTKSTTKYSGKVDGDTITGSVERPGRNGGDPTKRDWTATKDK